jgi:hypothetical protein
MCRCGCIAGVDHITELVQPEEDGEEGASEVGGGRRYMFT